MAVNARTLIEDALSDLAVRTAGVELSPGEAQESLRKLNRWRDWLGVDRAIMYEQTYGTFPLVAGTAQYTLGSGGVFNVPWPRWIDYAGLVLDDTANPATEVELDILSDEEFTKWSPVFQGQPTAIYFDRHWDAGVGTVSVFPIPSSSNYALSLYMPGNPVSHFADLTTEYSFPPGYERFVQKSLALELAPMFSAVPSRELYQQAIDSRKALEGSNVQPVKRRSSPGLVGCGSWDFESGRYR